MKSKVVLAGTSTTEMPIRNVYKNLHLQIDPKQVDYNIISYGISPSFPYFYYFLIILKTM